MSLMLQLWQHYFLKSTHKLEVPAVCISGSLRVAKPRHSGAPRSIGAQFKVGRTAFSRTSGQRADEGGGGEFRVLVLIIVGVGKERVGEETRGGALPLVGAAEGLTLLGSQLGEDGSCLLALGPIGAHRKQLGMLASPTTKILVFVGDCVDNCGCRGCCQTGALTSMEELD